MLKEGNTDLLVENLKSIFNEVCQHTAFDTDEQKLLSAFCNIFWTEIEGEIIFSEGFGEHVKQFVTKLKSTEEKANQITNSKEIAEIEGVLESLKQHSGQGDQVDFNKMVDSSFVLLKRCKDSEIKNFSRQEVLAKVAAGLNKAEKENLHAQFVQINILILTAVKQALIYIQSFEVNTQYVEECKSFHPQAEKPTASEELKQLVTAEQNCKWLKKNHKEVLLKLANFEMQDGGSVISDSKKLLPGLLDLLSTVMLDVKWKEVHEVDSAALSFVGKKNVIKRCLEFIEGYRLSQNEASIEIKNLLKLKFNSVLEIITQSAKTYIAFNKARSNIKINLRANTIKLGRLWHNILNSHVGICEIGGFRGVVFQFSDDEYGILFSRNGKLTCMQFPKSICNYANSELTYLSFDAGIVYFQDLSVVECLLSYLNDAPRVVVDGEDENLLLYQSSLKFSLALEKLDSKLCYEFVNNIFSEGHQEERILKLHKEMIRKLLDGWVMSGKVKSLGQDVFFVLTKEFFVNDKETCLMHNGFEVKVGVQGRQKEVTLSNANIPITLKLFNQYHRSRFQKLLDEKKKHCRAVVKEAVDSLDADQYSAQRSMLIDLLVTLFADEKSTYQQVVTVDMAKEDNVSILLLESAIDEIKKKSALGKSLKSKKSKSKGGKNPRAYRTKGKNPTVETVSDAQAAIVFLNKVKKWVDIADGLEDEWFKGLGNTSPQPSVMKAEAASFGSAEVVMKKKKKKKKKKQKSSESPENEAAEMNKYAGMLEPSKSEISSGYSSSDPSPHVSSDLDKKVQAGSSSENESDEHVYTAAEIKLKNARESASAEKERADFFEHKVSVLEKLLQLENDKLKSERSESGVLSEKLEMMGISLAEHKKKHTGDLAGLKQQYADLQCESNQNKAAASLKSIEHKLKIASLETEKGALVKQVTLFKDQKDKLQHDLNKAAERNNVLGAALSQLKEITENLENEVDSRLNHVSSDDEDNLAYNELDALVQTLNFYQNFEYNSSGCTQIYNGLNASPSQFLMYHLDAVRNIDHLLTNIVRVSSQFSNSRKDLTNNKGWQEKVTLILLEIKRVLAEIFPRDSNDEQTDPTEPPIPQT